MPVLRVPEVGAQAAWMRHALLVAALAGAGMPGAEPEVPGSTLETTGDVRRGGP